MPTSKNKTTRKVTLKAWGCVFNNAIGGTIPMMKEEHRNIQQRMAIKQEGIYAIFELKKDAIFYKGNYGYEQVVPCEITYQIKTNKK